MSKAHDPDRSAALWYSAGRSSAEADAMPADAQALATASGDETREISVEIWLFGLLSTMSAERPVKLTLPAKSTTEDVLASLGEHIGWECLEQVKDGKGGLLPHCRVIVNDAAIEDVTAPIAPDGQAATVEMILLKGFEGG
jgi:hypothetical protein